MAENHRYTFDVHYQKKNSQTYGSTEFHTTRTVSASSESDAKRDLRSNEERAGHKLVRADLKSSK